LASSARDKFTASVDGNEAAILYVANKDYLRCLSWMTHPAGDWLWYSSFAGMFSTFVQQQAPTPRAAALCCQRSSQGCGDESALRRRRQTSLRRQAICFASSFK
jgi:hypothetical protein